MAATRLSNRRITTLAIAALVLVALAWSAYRASHLLFPNFWLPVSTAPFKPEGAVTRVDPHIYDQQWFDAARAGRGDISQALLDAGFPVNALTGSHYSALVLAAYHGHTDEVALLLRAKADPCLADNNGSTALMGALFKGEMAVARQLLDYCPIDQVNGNGQTALAFAALFGRLDILPDLIARGADPQHQDSDGKTPLMIVMQQGNDAAAAALRSAGATR